MSATTRPIKSGGVRSVTPRQAGSQGATPTKCVDGKKHNWQYMGGGIKIGYGSYVESKWCSKCGSYTEFYRVNGKNSRAMENGKPFIQIPQVSK